MKTKLVHYDPYNNRFLLCGKGGTAVSNSDIVRVTCKVCLAKALTKAEVK
jgi:hypothetical protein